MLRCTAAVHARYAGPRHARGSATGTRGGTVFETYSASITTKVPRALRGRDNRETRRTRGARRRDERTRSAQLPSALHRSSSVRGRHAYRDPGKRHVRRRLRGFGARRPARRWTVHAAVFVELRRRNPLTNTPRDDHRRSTDVRNNDRYAPPRIPTRPDRLPRPVNVTDAHIDTV